MSRLHGGTDERRADVERPTGLQPLRVRLGGLARYLSNPKGDDAGLDTSDLSTKVDKALVRLRAQREQLDGPDDAEPPTDLLDALVHARDAAVSVDVMTDAKKHAAPAIGNMQDARMKLWRLTDH